MNCQNLREEHNNTILCDNIHHPLDCTCDVYHGFCVGGARIVGFDVLKDIFRGYFKITLK